MSMTKQTYSAPKLTCYGKLAELTQAGSVLVTTQQIPVGGGVSAPGQFYNTDNDGSTDLDSIDVVEITTRSGERKLIPVKFVNKFFHGFTQGFIYRYDSNGNGGADLEIYDYGNNKTIDLISTPNESGINPWQGYYNS